MSLITLSVLILLFWASVEPMKAFYSSGLHTVSLPIDPNLQVNKDCADSISAFPPASELAPNRSETIVLGHGGARL